MKRNNIIFIVFVLIIIGCGQNYSEKTVNSQTQNIPVDTSKIAILKIDTAFFYLPKKIRPTELTHQELVNIEILLVESVNDSSSQIQELSKYKRQYIPYLNEKGDKLVWVNCFCGDRFEYWKRTIVLVADGGSCFFNVTINLTQNNFNQLMVNAKG